MAIIKEQIIKESFSEQLDGGVVNRSMNVEYLIETDGSDDTASVRTNTSLAAIGSRHATDTTLILIDRQIQRAAATESLKMFRGILKYSTKTNGDVAIEENPLLRPPKVSWGGSSEKEEYSIDLEETEVKNTAGEAFSENPKRKAFKAKARISKNFSGYSPSALSGIVNTINDGNVSISDGKTNFTFSAKKWLMAEPNISELKLENEVYFYTLTFNLESTDTEGKRKIVSNGSQELVEGELKPIVNPATNEFYEINVPLTEAGAFAGATGTGFVQEFVEHLPSNWGTFL